MFERSLREVVQSVHVSYPVPYIVTVLLLSALAFSGAAAIFGEPERLMLVVTAMGLVLASIGIVGWALIRSPTLLKSETFMVLDQIMSVLGDSDMSAGDRLRLQSEVISTLSVPRSERHGRLAPPEAPQEDKDDA